MYNCPSCKFKTIKILDRILPFLNKRKCSNCGVKWKLKQNNYYYFFLFIFAMFPTVIFGIFEGYYLYCVFSLYLILVYCFVNGFLTDIVEE